MSIPTDLPAPSSSAPEPVTARRIALRVLFGFLAIGFVAFWTWALFFASKEGVNVIGDRDWAERAQAICVDANEQRNELTDLRPVDEGGPEAVRERAGILDEATLLIEAMLDEVVAEMPTDDKGREIVPLWEADYRIHIDDRRTYSDELREAGENLAFYETATDEGIPVSEKVATFAVDNSMPSCAPPTDL